MSIDWRTPHEKAKDEENARLAARFKELASQAPSVRRALQKLAEEEGLNAEALRHRMIRIGAITPRARKPHAGGSKAEL